MAIDTLQKRSGPTATTAAEAFQEALTSTYVDLCHIRELADMVDEHYIAESPRAAALACGIDKLAEGVQAKLQRLADASQGVAHG